ncbi:hypothetical protein HY449_04750 [Candidatus Pacearchaeota archaeon]|nr:hypothetical protein [Candidatus Pacearchaeota archaeon]
MKNEVEQFYEFRENFPIFAMILFAAGTMVYVMLDGDRICSTREKKPAERPRIEYKDVNLDGREDMIIYSGGRKQIFLRRPNGEYIPGNLEKSVQELNDVGRK